MNGLSNRVEFMKVLTLAVVSALAPGMLVAADVPAKVLDLTHWKLTVPMSSSGSGPAAEIKQPQLATFQDRNVFFVDSRAKAVVFLRSVRRRYDEGLQVPAVRAARDERQQSGISGGLGNHGSRDSHAHGHRGRDPFARS